MVSEPSRFSAKLAMENEGDEMYLLKFKPRSGFHLSDLKNIVDQHFNLPHLQVTYGENGCVVLTGLFDGIPDDVESQDHELFDHILEFIGWIEGRVQLSECSKSVAPKLFDESLRAMEESSDQHIHDEFEVTLANSDQISPKEVPLDEIPTCDVTNDDDMLIDEGLNVDDAVKGDEEIVQMELNDELILMKEFSDLVAHQVFDEMPRMMASHEINFDVPKLSGVASLGAVVNQPNRLHSKFDHDKVYPKLHKSVLETYVNSVACLELHYFDPGGKGLRLGGASVSNENEITDGKLDHKAIPVGSVEEQDDLKTFEAIKAGEHKENILPLRLDGEPHNLTVFEVYKLKVMPLLLIENKPIDHIKLMIDILIVDDIENVYAKMMCFDPGGGLYASSEIYTYFKLSTIDIFMMMGFEKGKSAFDMCLVTNAYVGVLIFDPGGEMIVGKSVILAIFADFNPTANYFAPGYSEGV